MMKTWLTVAFVSVFLASCASTHDTKPDSTRSPSAHSSGSCKAGASKCDGDAECCSRNCGDGICTPYKECHGPDDCNTVASCRGKPDCKPEACWNKVGCIPATCTTDHDCWQNQHCGSNGWCNYGE